MKVKLVSSKYVPFGYYKNHIYEVLEQSDSGKLKLTRNDNQTPCWVKRNDVVTDRDSDLIKEIFNED